MCNIVCSFSSGGLPGRKGLNLMHYKDGRVVNLGGKTSVHCQAGVSVLCHIQMTGKNKQSKKELNLIHYKDGRVVDMGKKHLCIVKHG